MKRRGLCLALGTRPRGAFHFGTYCVARVDSVEEISGGKQGIIFIRGSSCDRMGRVRQGVCLLLGVCERQRFDRSLNCSILVGCKLTASLSITLAHSPIRPHSFFCRVVVGIVTSGLPSGPRVGFSPPRFHTMSISARTC